MIQTNHNGGYGAGNNFGMRYLAKHGMPQFVLQCNPDVIVSEATIKKMEAFLKKHNNYMIAAPFMHDKNGNKISYSSFPLATKWQFIFSLDIVLNKILPLNSYSNLLMCRADYKEVGAVAGSLFMMNLPKMLKTRMYDENIFLYCEEMSLGFRIKKTSYKIALLPQESFIHNHSVSISKTFKSEYAKRKLLTNSKLYMIREYYHANEFEYLLAFILSRLSFIELQILQFMKFFIVKYF